MIILDWVILKGKRGFDGDEEEQDLLRKN